MLGEIGIDGTETLSSQFHWQKNPAHLSLLITHIHTLGHPDPLFLITKLLNYDFSVKLDNN